jgi:hypothetical protein
VPPQALPGDALGGGGGEEAGGGDAKGAQGEAAWRGARERDGGERERHPSHIIP